MKRIYYPILFLFLLTTPIFGLEGSRGAFLEKIGNTHSAFSVQVEADHPDGVYSEGELLRASVTSREDGYLYLFYRDADAKVTVLFPNRYQRDNLIHRNENVPVPGPGAGFQIRVGVPFGDELLKAVVSKKPLTFIDDAMDFAKFSIAQVDDNAGVNIANALEREAESPDWAEHAINIRTVPKPSGGGGDHSPPPSPNSKAKIHLILAADISSADAVGSVVQSDTYNLRKLIESNVAGGQLNIIDLQEKLRGNQLTKENMFREIRNLNVNPDDTIFLFYSGHGAFDSVAGQYFALASQEQAFRSEVLGAMKSKNARLSVLISDCCHNQADVPTHLRPAQPRGEEQAEIKGLRPLFNKLFFEAEGVVDITASEKGTYGFIYPKDSREENGESKGSVFTWNLCKMMKTEM
ncbi:MAG: DUF4384 domain-containing protein, partial [Planctomycetaceae bacterium]|nr:DUF4384 domain-containing protein [Planctomycetaceae bacterium]